jgi:hypothetical protein
MKQPAETTEPGRIIRHDQKVICNTGLLWHRPPAVHLRNGVSTLAQALRCEWQRCPRAKMPLLQGSALGPGQAGTGLSEGAGDRMKPTQIIHH